MSKSAFVCFTAFALAVPVWAQEAPVVPTAPEGMVYVPAGGFLMGTNDRDRTDFNQRDNVPLNSNDARPQHQPSTGAFFIDKTEVTNAQYKKYCDATGYPAPPIWKDGQFPSGQGEFPVSHVDFYEAQAFAKWAGKRLPSEIEWEKAARGTDGRLYPWGSDWRGDSGNTDSQSLRAVGSFPNGASPYGALDMAGNVMEWTTNWFDGYPDAPTKQPDFGKQTLKVVRGGALYDGRGMGQTWYRAVMRPRARTTFVGFRCVQDVK